MTGKRERNKQANRQAILDAALKIFLDRGYEGVTVRDVIGEFRDRGATVLLISHALSEVAHLCDRVAVLVEGRKVYDGSLAGLGFDPLPAVRRGRTRARPR